MYPTGVTKLAQQWVLYVDESGLLPIAGRYSKQRGGPVSVTGLLMPREGAQLAQDIARRQAMRKLPFAGWPLHGTEFKSPLWILLAFTNRNSNPLGYGRVTPEFAARQPRILNAGHELRRYLQTHHSRFVEAFDESFPHRAYETSEGQLISRGYLSSIRRDLARNSPKAWSEVVPYLESVAKAARYDLPRQLFLLTQAELFSVGEDQECAAWDVSGEQDSYAALLEELFVRVRERLASVPGGAEVALRIAKRFVFDERNGSHVFMGMPWIRQMFTRKVGFRTFGRARSEVRCSDVAVIDYKVDATAAMVVADMLANPLAFTLFERQTNVSQIDSILRSAVGTSILHPGLITSNPSGAPFISVASVGKSSVKLQEFRCDGELPQLTKRSKTWVRDQYDGHAKYLIDSKLL